MPKRHEPHPAPPPRARRTRAGERGSALARFVLSGPDVPPAAKPPPVLLLARPGPESDELFADLSRREDLCLLRVATATAASRAIEEMPVALVVASPETPVADVEAVLARLERRRPGTPVLAIRTRRAAEPADWSARGVAVLRLPLVAGALGRSVDVVLGMKGRR